MPDNPTSQSTEEIVSALLGNKSRQYTESAHAEIWSRLIVTIRDFNQKAQRTEKFMLILAVSQVILATAQIFLGSAQLR